MHDAAIVQALNYTAYTVYFVLYLAFGLFFMCHAWMDLNLSLRVSIAFLFFWPLYVLAKTAFGVFFMLVRILSMLRKGAAR